MAGFTGNKGRIQHAVALSIYVFHYYELSFIYVYMKRKDVHIGKRMESSLEDVYRLRSSFVRSLNSTSVSGPSDRVSYVVVVDKDHADDVLSRRDR